MADATTATEAGCTGPQARTVIYCGGRPTFPSCLDDYCEFGGTVKKCEEWLKANHEELWDGIYNDATLSAALTPLSLDAQKRADKDASKKAAKAAAQDAAAETRRQTSKVSIRRVERSKRKHVTAVAGLDAHGLDLKKVAKELGKKFATGSSVTKVAGGGDEIVVQGDLAEEIEDWIVDNFKEIPEGNVEVVEDRKRKAGGAG